MESSDAGMQRYIPIMEEATMDMWKTLKEIRAGLNAASSQVHF
jgi:hypothetical protein